MFYIVRKPAIYEARYKFSLQDDFVQDNYLQYSDEQEKYIANQTVFIAAEDLHLILKTDPILQSLNDLEEIEDYKTEISTSLINLELDEGTSIFLLKVKNTDRELAGKIALNLIESLGRKIEIEDKKVFDNTIEMINGDIRAVEDEIALFNGKIAELEGQVQDQTSGGGLQSGGEINYDILEKNGEILIYREKVIDNEYKIQKLAGLLDKFQSEKENTKNRIKILTEKPGYDVENNMLINAIIVVLLSILTGIIAILAVNYIYKLKSYKNNRK
jgi:hypothetical protein